ncbi:MAG: alkaline phosphatase family protein [Nocardioidaceae bacterium]
MSNEAGRRPKSGDFVNYSYDSAVRADRVDGRATSGTVSMVDLDRKRVAHTVDVGLDPSALLVDGSNVLVTNSSDDTVSVIDRSSARVTRTFNVNPLPGQPFGSSPNALVRLNKDHVAVSLGRDNALAVYEYEGRTSTPVFDGLIPTAWYPGKVLMDKHLGKLVVGNLKGVGALGKKRTILQGPGTDPATSHQVYADIGVVQTLNVPKPDEMAALTARVFALNQWDGIKARNAVSTGDAPAAPVPARIGDPSPIKHIFLIVRENRTYDQELGELKRGNGDASLTQFGEQVTPNAHALARRYGTIDNLYSDGTNSATGHTWLDAAWVNDYLERSYANYVRNYGQPDAMVYPKSGFLWDNAITHGLDARVWGEYAEYFTGPNGQPASGDWKDWYRDSQILEGQRQGKLHAPLGYYTTKADVPSLNKILEPDYPNFQTQIPDQYRADIFLRDLKGYEKSGNLPALNMLWVMADHTEGTVPGYPTPSAMVADNDLATGRIVDAISHSKFWKSGAIFIVEDDSQSGVDHVDGHRNVLLVASPYARRGAVVHDYYSQLNVTRTIEQILGLPPMNQLDLVAEPMYDVFTDKPDFTPYTFQHNRIPLDTMNPTSNQADSPLQREWISWSQQQDFTKPDMVNFEAFNRLTWYSSYGFARAYPGDAKVLTPGEVAARFPQTPLTSDPDGTLPQTRAQVPHVAGR